MAEKSKELLRVDDLAIIYKTDLETVHAVNGITFSLERGRTLGLVGETGAGKTTTALALLRLLPERIGIVTGGSIRFDGEDLMSLPPTEMRKIRGNRISMIFQDPMTSLNPVLTVGDQIAEALVLHGEGEKARDKVVQAKVDEVLSLVGIPPTRKNEYPHQFSGGMKQRVVIAIALACEPDLLIADEPTTALDVTIQAQVLKMMRDLKERLDTSMILITHDLGVVACTCDDVAVMYAGKIIECGTREDLFREGRHHPYTVGLFGSIPDIHSETTRLSPIGGLMPDPTNLPPGCSFSPRCPRCMEICRTTEPPETTDGTHKILCHLYGEGGRSR
ncbi:ABC transporter ATP-binding protein [Synergistaceae bacterium OttesenSCG-928-I11]|nr:ABC transporter ATP-binding protein [Synergistaceae bacterium OttesenSCG-928-I11]